MDFEKARSGESFTTTCALWCPDPKSDWGRCLSFVWRRLQRKRLQIPEGLTFAWYRGAYSMSRRKARQQMRLWPSVFCAGNDSDPIPATQLLHGLLVGMTSPHASESIS